MPSIYQTLSAIVASAATANAAFGPYFSTGPTSSSTYIKESTATLILPAAPSNNNGDLSLWVGMGTSAGDLIQSIADCYQCTSTTWSLFAYTLKSTGPNSQEVIQGPSAPASAAQQVTMHCTFNTADSALSVSCKLTITLTDVYSASTGNYTQTVTRNGVVVSTLSTSDGFAEGYGSAVECAAEDCGTVPAHQWTNVQIILSGSDPEYINTFALAGGTTGSMSTSDGGTTWNLGTINVPAFTF